MTTRIAEQRRTASLLAAACARTALVAAIALAAACQPVPSAPAVDAAPVPPPPRPDAAVQDPPPPPDASTAVTPDAAPPEDTAPLTDAVPPTDAVPVVTLFENPLAPPPANLNDVGLFTALPDLTAVDTRAFDFEPRFPLWSNGLEKLRHMILPQGELGIGKINTANREAWDFPVGTLFFKTFTQDPSADGKVRPVETRLIRRIKADGPVGEQWEFFAYQWNDAGTDAVLLTNRTYQVPVNVTIKSKPVTHNIPSQIDCRSCHISNLSPIIGFDELRLNGRRGAATSTQLQDVIAKGWLSSPPSPPFAEVVEPNPAQKWIREYMHANCGHCHNGGPPVGNITRLYDLREKAFLGNTIGKRVEERSAEGLRIVPGNPELSVLYLAFRRDRTMHPELKPMPEIGVDVVDEDAAKRLYDWIRSLPAQ